MAKSRGRKEKYSGREREGALGKAHLGALSLIQFGPGREREIT